MAIKWPFSFGSPQGVGRCRGGNRNVVGWRGFLQLKIKKQMYKVLQLKMNNKIQKVWVPLLEITKFPFHFFGKVCFPYYRIPISCFWIETDPIFKICRSLLDGSSGFSRSLLLHNVHHVGVAIFWYWQKDYVSKMNRDVLHGHDFENPENDRFSGLSKVKSTSC